MKIQARYENGVLIPEKPLFPKGATLTIDVPEENLQPDPADAASPQPVEPIDWTEEELKTFESFPGLRKAWEILRSPPPEIYEAEELTNRQKAMWEAINYATQER